MRKTLVGMFAGLVLGVALTAGLRVASGQTGSDPALTGVVPDMEKIYKSALSNMFEAAGEKFTDPELKAFYDRLTGDITDSLDEEPPYDPAVPVANKS